MNKRLLHGLAVVLSLTAACSEPTQPTTRLSLLVGPDTVVPVLTVFGAVTWMQFTLPITAHNSGPSNVSFNYCAVAIENDDASAPHEVWVPVCTTSSGHPPSIGPGETVGLSIDVAAAVSGPAGPSWQNDSVSGTYRFRAQVYPDHGPSPLTITSNAFVLRSSQ